MSWLSRLLGNDQPSSQVPQATSAAAVTPVVTSCTAAISSGASAYTNIPSIVSAKTPTEINELAQNYDADTTLPWKSQHAPFLLSAHPDFGAHMKAFMFNAWKDLGAKIRINSVYRTPERQAELLREYNANPSGKARPGTRSYHLYGMAMDFNPTLADGTKLGKSFSSYGSNSLAAAWIDSGLVAAGERVNLYWGGRFPDNYDPIHFDFRNVAISINSLSSLVTSQNMASAPNRVDLA